MLPGKFLRTRDLSDALQYQPGEAATAAAAAEAAAPPPPQLTYCHGLVRPQFQAAAAAAATTSPTVATSRGAGGESPMSERSIPRQDDGAALPSGAGADDDDAAAAACGGIGLDLVRRRVVEVVSMPCDGPLVPPDVARQVCLAPFLHAAIQAYNNNNTTTSNDVGGPVSTTGTTGDTPSRGHKSAAAAAAAETPAAGRKTLIDMAAVDLPATLHVEPLHVDAVGRLSGGRVDLGYAVNTADQYPHQPPGNHNRSNRGSPKSRRSGSPASPARLTDAKTNRAKRAEAVARARLTAAAHMLAVACTLQEAGIGGNAEWAAITQQRVADDDAVLRHYSDVDVERAASRSLTLPTPLTLTHVGHFRVLYHGHVGHYPLDVRAPEVLFGGGGGGGTGETAPLAPLCESWAVGCAMAHALRGTPVVPSPTKLLEDGLDDDPASLKACEPSFVPAKGHQGSVEDSNGGSGTSSGVFDESSVGFLASKSVSFAAPPPRAAAAPATEVEFAVVRALVKQFGKLPEDVSHLPRGRALLARPIFTAGSGGGTIVSAIAEKYPVVGRCVAALLATSPSSRVSPQDAFELATHPSHTTSSASVIAGSFAASSAGPSPLSVGRSSTGAFQQDENLCGLPSPAAACVSCIQGLLKEQVSSVRLASVEPHTHHAPHPHTSAPYAHGHHHGVHWERAETTAFGVAVESVLLGGRLGEKRDGVTPCWTPAQLAAFDKWSRRIDAIGGSCAYTAIAASVWRTQPEASDEWLTQKGVNGRVRSAHVFLAAYALAAAVEAPCTAIHPITGAPAAWADDVERVMVAVLTGSTNSGTTGDAATTLPLWPVKAAQLTLIKSGAWGRHLLQGSAPNCIMAALLPGRCSDRPVTTSTLWHTNLVHVLQSLHRSTAQLMDQWAEDGVLAEDAAMLLGANLSVTERDLFEAATAVQRQHSRRHHHHQQTPTSNASAQASLTSSMVDRPESAAMLDEMMMVSASLRRLLHLRFGVTISAGGDNTSSSSL